MLQIVKHHQHSHLQIYVPEVTDKIMFVFRNVKKKQTVLSKDGKVTDLLNDAGEKFYTGLSQLFIECIKKSISKLWLKKQ